MYPPDIGRSAVLPAKMQEKEQRIFACKKWERRRKAKAQEFLTGIH